MSASRVAGDERLPRTAIGIDIGGTKIAAGVVSEEGDVLGTRQIAAPKASDHSATLDALLGLIVDLRKTHSGVAAIGVGAAGMVDWPSGYVRWAPNNPYHALPLRDLLVERTRLPATVENDANAAAAGEARFGGGAGHRNSITMTVGTGIGGGILIDGRIFRGPTGIGAEVGHVLVNPEEGSPCNCGSQGCLETMASGTALAREGKRAAEADPNGHLARLARDSGELTGATVFAAARQGDARAAELFDRLGFWLGVGIASLVTLFDPGVVILGGGIVAQAADMVIPPAVASFERFVSFRDHRSLPAVVPACLGTQAGLVGAALLALERDPVIEGSS